MFHPGIAVQVRRPRTVNIRRPRTGAPASPADQTAGAAAPQSAMRGHGGSPSRVTGHKRVSISQPEITGVEVRIVGVALSSAPFRSPCLARFPWPSRSIPARYFHTCLHECQEKTPMLLWGCRGCVCCCGVGLGGDTGWHFGSFTGCAQ